MPDTEPLEGIRNSSRDAEMAEHYPTFKKSPEAQKPKEHQKKPEPTTEVGKFLELRQEDYAGRKEIGRTQTWKDILGLIRNEQSDLLGQKDDDPQAIDKIKKLTGLKDVVVEVATAKAAEVSDDSLREIGDYLVQKIEEDEKDGGRYQETLVKYLPHIHDRLLPEKYRTENRKRTEAPAEKETKADTNLQAEAKEDREEEQPKLPEYAYRPGEHLEKFFEEQHDKPVTLKTAKEFAIAARDDLKEQNDSFNTKNKDLIDAVDKAEEFLLAHADQRESGKIIKVVEDDGKIRVDWEESLKDVEGKSFRFDPSIDAKSLSLGDYVLKRKQYKDKLEGNELERTEGANQVVERLEKLLDTPRLKITAEELLPTLQLLARHEIFLENGFREIALRFDGVEQDKLQEVALADPESAARIDTLGKQRDIIRDIAVEVNKREKSKGVRMFRGVKKLGKMFHPGRKN